MKKSFMLWLFAAVLVFLFVGTLPLLSSTKEKGKPNEINILIFEGYGEPAWVDPFEEETGATVNITNATSVDEIFSKMVADKGRGFDLVTLDTSQFPRYHQQGLIIPVNMENIPNLKAEVLPEFHDIAITKFDGEQYGIPYAWGTIPMWYLADIMDEPDSWMAMWDQANSGKVIILDEPQNTMVLMGMIVGDVDDLYNLSEKDIDRIKDLVLTLAPNLRTLSTGSTDTINLIASGDAVVGMAFGEQTAFVAQQKGLNVGLTIPKEGATGWLDCWAISAGTQNKELAEAFINHCIIKEYNKAMSDTIGYPGCSNPPEGPPATYKMDRIQWMQPRGDYQRLGEAWEEIKLMMGQ